MPLFTSQVPRRAALAAACLLALAAGSAAQAQTFFNGIAAGDPSADGAVLWTRTSSVLDGATGLVANLSAQIATDANFSNIVQTLSGSSDAGRDFTLKLTASGLAAGGTYFYRFTDGSSTSAVGRFTTAPAASAAAAVKFGFTGDADGKWRPYGSIRNVAAQNNSFFVFLGDTIYETASTRSPAAASTTSTSALVTPAVLQADYQRKYREQLAPTAAGGFTGLQTFYTGTANYTLLDNHELGNVQFINGGAATGVVQANGIHPGVDRKNPLNDVNTSGTYLNKTAGFQALAQAYANYQPIRETTVVAPGDARSDGTLKMYNSQQWGKNLLMINTDDRSYRDIRMQAASGADDTGARADNAARTMLGTTQLAWLKSSLLQAKADGTTWKVISVSSPIDQLGATGSGLDSGKSWMGGYRAERNDLLKFIDDQDIENVVFLSTDDHFARVNELTYVDNGVVKVLPHAISIVAGPIGAGGPDAVTDHSFGGVAASYNQIAALQAATNGNGSFTNAIGLDPSTPGLRNVHREFDAQADANRSALDFYSPDTFNYAELAIGADGVLSVEVYGINSYAANTFPEPNDLANPVRNIFGFQLAPVPEPGTWALMLGGLALLMARRRRA